MLLPCDRRAFVLRLISKLSGEAKRSIQNRAYENLEDLINHFRRIYRPTESWKKLELKLANIYQLTEKFIISYKLRMAVLAEKLTAAFIAENTPNKESLTRFDNELITSCLRYFID